MANALAAHVSHCFGVMGNGNAYLLDALADTPVRYVPVRHEVGAVVAADAFYRACRRPAVATATYGPGFTNTLTGLTEAVQARTPLLLVVGDRPSAGPRPWDVDQPGVAAGLGAHTMVVDRHDPAGTTVRALQYALDHRTAVVLAVPYDLAAAPVDDQAVPDGTPQLVMPARLSPRPSEVARLAAILDSAERPLLLAGRGAWLADAGEALTRLAHHLGALTATTAAGRSIFRTAPDGIDADLGICGGFADDVAAKLIFSSDVVLAVGAGLNLFTMRHQTAFDPDATLLQIDIADRATHPRVAHYLQADARLAAEALLAELPGKPRRGWRDQTRTARDHRDPGSGLAPDGLLDPRTVAYELDDILPADRTVVSDGGHFIGWAPTYWRIPGPNRLIMVGTEFQSIGLGMPSAVGAGQALPETTVVLTTGDGGALMSLADLDTVIRTVRHGVIIVWNDGYYGAELHQYGSKGLDTGPMKIKTADFSGIARSFGAEAAVITEVADLDRLRHWLSTGREGVFLADCRVSPHVRAPYMQTQLDITAPR
ncbi:thiamine pyrophosphate-binding protein [Microlunatus sp. Gsoil 973]|nr:thiamine pyrophosphate-binding protein [Microlunatus sp. Gsoil 973]